MPLVGFIGLPLTLKSDQLTSKIRRRSKLSRIPEYMTRPAARSSAHNLSALARLLIEYNPAPKSGEPR